MKQKILIISQVIYPRLSPRAHRATELAKEFAREGHDVTLCAALGNADYSEFSEKYGIRIHDLKVSSFISVISQKEPRKLSLLQKIISLLLGYILDFPECMLANSVRRYLKHSESFDRIITIAMPHPIHWGMGYAKRHYKHLQNTTWIADCGDPFMGNPYSKHPFYFKRIEKKWCKTADYISVPTKESINGYYEEFHKKIRVIPQGFVFNEVKLAEYVKNPIPTFAYSGAVYPKLRDPRVLLDYLSSLQIDFRFVVYNAGSELFTAYVDKLQNKLDIRPYVPRELLLFELSKMDFLVNISNESSVQVPSKLIDYYQTKRPIIEINSKFENTKEFDAFMKCDYSSQLIIENSEQYDIKNVCSRFVEL